MTTAPQAAVVTGGSKGIGRAMAAALLESGRHVLVTGRNEASLRAAADLLSPLGTRAGVRVEWFAGDVRREDDARAGSGPAPCALAPDRGIMAPSNARRRHLRLITALGLALGLGAALHAAACGGQSKTPATPATPTPTPTQAAADVLRATHTGWKNPRCEACHALPIAEHQVVEQWRCAQCHGGNGACNPNGRPAARRHASTDACLSCHQATHQFTASEACVGCHLAATGTVTCEGPAGPGPPGTLQSGCFGWPATDFSPSNRASVATSLRAGQQAVDFALRDTAGATVRLSDLLRTKPVLLVHGAFT